MIISNIITSKHWLFCMIKIHRNFNVITMYCSKQYQKEKLKSMSGEEIKITFRALQTTSYLCLIIVAILKRLALPIVLTQTSDNFYAVFDIKIIVLGSKVQNNGTCFLYQFNNLQAHIKTRYGVRNKKNLNDLRSCIFVAFYLLVCCWYTNFFFINKQKMSPLIDHW